jgi:hypothetical protein
MLMILLAQSCTILHTFVRCSALNGPKSGPNFVACYAARPPSDYPNEMGIGGPRPKGHDSETAAVNGWLTCRSHSAVVETA